MDTSNDSDIVDTGAGAIDESAEVDATDEGAPSDDKTADDPNSADTRMAWITRLTVTGLTRRLAPLMRRQQLMPVMTSTPDDKDSDDPNVEDAIRDSSEENTKNKDAGGSGETKA